MNLFHSIFALVLVLSVFLCVKDPLLNFNELEKCPYCYGTDFCAEYDKLELRYDSFSHFFANQFSVKNVLYATYENKPVVLKKLAHDVELKQFDAELCSKNYMYRDCNVSAIQQRDLSFFSKIDGLAKSKLCRDAIASFIFRITYPMRSTFTSSDTQEINFWTSLHINVEPLIIRVLKSEQNWPVPKYLGTCGRVLVENDCGTGLNNYASANWSTRAILAKQLVIAAKNFTESDHACRYYLTDISPDNIAVDSDLKVTFIDLEDVVIVRKPFKRPAKIHHSVHDPQEDFAYSENELCASDLSDHNYYAVCKLLLSKAAPWPMMSGGLLHSPPKQIMKKYAHLFSWIELCVQPTDTIDRFEAANKLINILSDF